MALKVATWNVNSLNVRLGHLLQWLKGEPIDIVCLQETKLIDENFPVAALTAAGYRSLFSGQKTYNGVAILLRQDTVHEVANVQTQLPGIDDEQRRLIAATIDGIRVVCAYVPNGQAIGTDVDHGSLEHLTTAQEDRNHWRITPGAHGEIRQQPQDADRARATTAC